MEKDIKFELTKNELETLIFLAASRLCDRRELGAGEEAQKICEDAAEICAELTDHLTGKELFDPVQMRIADAVIHNKQTAIILGIKKQ